MGMEFIGLKLPKRIPHLKPEEMRVWERFAASNIISGKVYADVHLKPPDIPKPAFATPEEWAWYAYLKSPRIDAVIETSDCIYVVQVKDWLRQSAIGEVQFYYYHYINEFKPTKPVKMMIVAGRDNPKVREVCEKLGILVYIV
jgi:hypothetical protein